MATGESLHYCTDYALSSAASSYFRSGLAIIRMPCLSWLPSCHVKPHWPASPPGQASAGGFFDHRLVAAVLQLDKVSQASFALCPMRPGQATAGLLHAIGGRCPAWLIRRRNYHCCRFHWHTIQTTPPPLQPIRCNFHWNTQ